jgi:hypothetical protein
MLLRLTQHEEGDHHHRVEVRLEGNGVPREVEDAGTDFALA